jgi:GNAT superfamily N-acetyltransferase
MCPADLPSANALRRTAGWNQRPADWQRFLDLSPKSCFVAEAKDAIVGTVTTIGYGGALGWIGMLLVQPEVRSQGIGKALLTRAIEHLQRENIPSIKLDATPLGEGLYRRMGFRDEWSLARYKRILSASPDEPPGRVIDLSSGDTPRMVDLDAEAFGLQRPELFRSLLSSAQHAIALTNADEFEAFGFVRSGSVADYLGPVAACSDHAATEVILELVRRSTGRPLFWDIPSPNKAALALAEKLGFALERPLLRMYLGRNDHSGDLSKYFGIADPSLG